MKKYTKPIVEITVFVSADNIALGVSNTSSYETLKTKNGSATELGF